VTSLPLYMRTTLKSDPDCSGSAQKVPSSLHNFGGVMSCSSIVYRHLIRKQTVACDRSSAAKLAANENATFPGLDWYQCSVQNPTLESCFEA
jgi:hypothetical protein